jgi:hypothetical protein
MLATNVTVTAIVGRRIKEGQLRHVRDSIERELGRRVDSDLTPHAHYLELAQKERALMDELERLPG